MRPQLSVCPCVQADIAQAQYLQLASITLMGFIHSNFYAVSVRHRQRQQIQAMLDDDV